MKVSILTIGDEILNGTTIDTNSSFIAKNCVANGLQIVSTFSVSDTYQGINDGLLPNLTHNLWSEVNPSSLK